MALQHGAHIAAVPLNGQESPRAERTDCAKNNDLGRCPIWLVDCTVLNLVPYQESRTRSLSSSIDRKVSCSTFARDHAIKRRPIRRGSFVAILLAILDFLFGCHHLQLSRVFTLQGETYQVCCDCGARFAYSLETMSIERRLPFTPALTRFRVA
jgi:hypothetical protein